jgi:hypothetical protein
MSQLQIKLRCHCIETVTTRETGEVALRPCAQHAALAPRTGLLGSDRQVYRHWRSRPSRFRMLILATDLRHQCRTVVGC